MDIRESSSNTRPAQIKVCVNDPDGAPIENALILLYHIYRQTAAETKQAKGSGQRPEVPSYYAFTGSDGYATFTDIEPGEYEVECPNIPENQKRTDKVVAEQGCIRDLCFTLDAKLNVITKTLSDGCKETDCPNAIANETHSIEITSQIPGVLAEVRYPAPYTTDPTNKFKAYGLHASPGFYKASASILLSPPSVGAFAARSGAAIPSPSFRKPINTQVVQSGVRTIAGQIGVTLQRTASTPTADQALWAAIRNRTKAIGFGATGYQDFIDRVLCRQEPVISAVLNRQRQELGSQAYGVGAYELLKTATEVFLLLECGVSVKDKTALDGTTLFDPSDESARLGRSVTISDVTDLLIEYLGPGRLPYINRIIRTAFPGDIVGPIFCDGVLTSRVDCSCLIELIWNYWHEEGMLVQTMNAISRRFQNIRGPGSRDPLAHLEIDPLRPLNNLLWGYIQDEQNLLTVRRRAYEYDHHYGLALYGKAAPAIRPADSRSKFLEGFHNLLHLTAVFYKEDNDTTVIADGFPLLNALKEVHLLLAQGAHNQFGDLPWTARREMLIQQWLLSRQEMRDFLQSRAMVPYKEAWMPQVDTMKTMQGWTDVTITHFRDLAVYGEQILLSVRYGDWIDVNNEDSAKNWARYWRPEIQAYLHAYRACTGVDLTNADTLDFTIPAAHLQKRLVAQQQRVR